MKILTSGCSNSSTHPFEIVRNQLNAPIWPIRLSNILEYELVNISKGGKCNDLIFNDTVQYIVKDKNLPDIIIVQWTEFDRKSFFIPELSKEYVKVLPDQHNRVSITLPRQDKIFHTIGDPTQKTEQEEVLIKIISLQSICQIKNIPIYFINWFPFHQMKDNPLWNLIDTSTFLIENPCDGGWHNHLGWCEFNTIDEGHFNLKAHKYTANKLCNLITNNQQTLVEANPYIDKPIYDYTN